MKFTMLVKHKGERDDQAWREEMNKNVRDPEKYSRDIVKWFNDTRDGYARERVLVGVVIEDNKQPTKHGWEKTNTFTLQHKGDFYDKYRCKRCGITAKRYGIGGAITPDNRAKKYRTCDWKNGTDDER